MQEKQDYLSFTLNGENFATPLIRVQEIYQMQEIIPAQNEGSPVLGTVRLREKLFPVVDMRRLVTTQESSASTESCIIVFSIDGVEVGAIVDKVQDIISISSEDIRSLNVPGSPVYGTGDFKYQSFKLINSDELLSRIDLVRSGIAS